MKLALTIALASSLSLLACAENTANAQNSTEASPMLYSKSITFEYDSSLGPFSDRFLPIQRFESVSEDDIMSIFSNGMTLQLPSSYTAHFRSYADQSSCTDQDYSKRLISEYGIIPNPEYTSAFMDKWNAMRFGSSAHYGPIIAVITDDRTKKISGYIEQRQHVKEAEKLHFAVSTNNPMDARLLLIDSDLTAAKSPSLMHSSSSVTLDCYPVSLIEGAQFARRHGKQISEFIESAT